MAAPVNISAATAIDLGPFPASVSQDVNDSGTTYTVWYKFTPAADGVVSVFGFGDVSVYKPFTNTYLGPDSSPVQYVVAEGQNKPVYIPVNAGVTVYLRFRAPGNVSPAVLLIEASTFVPAASVPLNSISVNDDTPGLPMAIVSRATGEVLRYIQGIVAGEEADILLNGKSLLEDVSQYASDEIRLALYDAGMNLFTTISETLPISGADRVYISSNRTSLFYVGLDDDFDHFDPLDGPAFATINTAGVRSAWTLLEGSGLTGLCPNLDETILYYSGRDGSGDRPIKRWDLANGVGLSNLVANLSGYTPHTIIVLLDGTLVVLYQNASLDTIVKHYNAAGATLHTLSYGASSDSRLARDPDGVSFWLWTKAVSAGVITGASLFQRLLPDGTVVESNAGHVFDKGRYGGAATATPAALFGVSKSCPFFLLGTSVRTIPRLLDNSVACCADPCACEPPAGGGPAPSPAGATGPIEDPIVAELWYPSCEGGGDVPEAPEVTLDEDWAGEGIPLEPETCLTIEPEPIKWGRRPISGRGEFVEGRLIEVGEIERASSDKWGNYAPARLRVVEQDSDASLRTALAAPTRKHFLNREARFEIRSAQGRRAGLAWRPLIQGRVTSTQPELERRGVVEVQDIVGSQYGTLDPEKLIGILVGDEAPSKPIASVGRSYPFVLGEHNDFGKHNSLGESVEKGVLPVVDCGDTLLPGEVPDPDGREFDLGLNRVIDQALNNETGAGDITITTYGKVAPIIAGVMGPPSLTLVLDPVGDGAGGPALAHAHLHSILDVYAGAADSYIFWMFQNPAFDPVTNPTGDPTVRYKIVSGTPTFPAFPPRSEPPATWDIQAAFASLTDGDQWGLQTTSAPTNLQATVNGTPGTTTYTYDVAALTNLGESRPAGAITVPNGPAVLDGTDNITITADPPLDNPGDVVSYRVIGRTPGATYLAIVDAGAGSPALSFVDDGTHAPKSFNVSSGNASDGVAWIAAGLGICDLHAIYGSDLAENDTPKRVRLDLEAGDIIAPSSSFWPHAEPYRIIGGITQTGFYASGPRLQHHRDGIVTFAWNGCGWKDAAGLLINQAARMLVIILNEAVEKNNGLGYRTGAIGPIELFGNGMPKFLTQLMEAAQAASAARMGTALGWIGAVCIPEPSSVREILRRFLVSFPFRLTSEAYGPIFLFLIPTGAAAPTEGVPFYRDRMEIKRLAGHYFAYDELENRLEVSWLMDWDAQAFRITGRRFEDAVSIAAHGGDQVGVYSRGALDMFYQNDEATLVDCAAYMLELYGEPPRYMKTVLGLQALEKPNGTSIVVRHRKEGLGAQGEPATPGCILSTNILTTPYEVTQTILLAAGASFGLALGDEATMSGNLGDETSSEPPPVGAFRLGAG